MVSKFVNAVYHYPNGERKLKQFVRETDIAAAEAVGVRVEVVGITPKKKWIPAKDDEDQMKEEE